MASNQYRQAPSAPNNSEFEDYPPPKVPARMDQQPTEQPLLPRRMDLPESKTTTSTHQDCSCNYNRYATKKTVAHGALEFALITSNAMQLRTLIIQKQRDSIWLASLILVCISVLIQIILAYILIVVGKGDIQNPEKQARLEKYNNIALFLTILISMINVVINAFMTSTNASSYLDPMLLKPSNNHT